MAVSDTDFITLANEHGFVAVPRDVLEVTKWKEVGARRWKPREAIRCLEASAVVWVVRRACRDQKYRGKRLLMFSESTCVCVCALRGRQGLSCRLQAAGRP